MKITESRIRQYIRQLLMETFNVGPDGIAIPNAVFRSQNPQIASTLPEDVPQIIRSFPAKLARAAKAQWYNFKIDNPDIYQLIMDKATILLTGNVDVGKDFFNSITFTESDVRMVNTAVYDWFQQDPSAKESVLNILLAFPGLENFVEYLRAIFTATDDLSRVPPSPESYTTLNANDPVVFGANGIDVFFSPPDNPNDTGMGESLVDYIIDRIVSGMMQVKNKTPEEFAQIFYPEFEKYINIMFQKNPIIAKNADKMIPIKNAYLDSILYVLVELIAELNFEFLYNGEVGSNLTSTNPEDLLIFLPDDRLLLSKTAEVVKNLGIDGKWEWNDFKTNLSDTYRPHGWARYEAPELRSMPSYYDIKFSFNPKFASIAGNEIKNNFHARLHDNLVFGVGFSKYLVKYNLDFDDYEYIAELWENS